MSYIRWSDDERSDIYCYLSTDNKYHTMIAQVRQIKEIPDQYDADLSYLNDHYFDHYQNIGLALDEDHEWPVELVNLSIEDMEKTIYKLQCLGYQVPLHVYDRIDEEIKEENKKWNLWKLIKQKIL